MSIRSVAAMIGLLVLSHASAAPGQTVQEHVHHMSPRVMPFDVSKALHVFRMTDSGGEQRVIARDPGNLREVALIRRHLRHEAIRFRHGDYSDPAALHGAGMPGLAELRAGASRIHVSYADVPAGGALTFRTNDRHLITAIHRWFGAQLSEHGADARAE